MVDRYKGELGPKVNETLVFHETVGKEFTQTAGLRRNLTMASTIPPEKLHVARIRKSYEMHQTKSFIDYHGAFSPRFTSPFSARKSSTDLNPVTLTKKRSRNIALGKSHEFVSSPLKRRLNKEPKQMISAVPSQEL